MRVAQIGNFVPTYSTENELEHALRQLDVDVWTVQEGEPDEMKDLIDSLRSGERYDFILWTRTKDLADRNGPALQWEMIAEARRAHVPVVGYHLDRWWGLKRQSDVYMEPKEPFFYVDWLFTADGAHQDFWRERGIDHLWALPAISERWCQLGVPKPEYECDVLFVGSWRGYHREWMHRQELVSKMSDRYGERFRVIPGPGQEAIRGLELNDVYASAKVVVGDSCLAPTARGTTMTHYCSDRIPETLGRGGILFHPEVEGVTHGGGFDTAPGLFTWEFGEWQDLYFQIDELLDEFPHRQQLAEHTIRYIKENHTYTKRMETLIEFLQQAENGLL